MFDAQRILFNRPNVFSFCNADYLVLHASSFSYNLRKLYAAVKIFNLYRMYQLDGTQFFIFSNSELCPRGNCIGNLSLSPRILRASLEHAAANKYRTQSMIFVGCAMRTTVGRIAGHSLIVGPYAPAATLVIPDIPMGKGSYKIALNYRYEGDGVPTLELLSDGGNTKVSMPQKTDTSPLETNTIEFFGEVTPMTIAITYPGQGQLQIRSVTLQPLRKL